MARHRRTSSKLLLVLTTLFTLSNGSISFPGSSFFSSGIFSGFKATEAPSAAAIVDPIQAGSDASAQFTTIDIGSGTSTSQQSGGTGLSTTGGFFFGGQGSPPSHGGSSSHQVNSPASPPSSPLHNGGLQSALVLSSYLGQQSQSTLPHGSLSSHGGSQSSSPLSHTYGTTLSAPQVTSFGGPQSYGGSFQQQPLRQNNVYPSIKGPQSNLPMATYSSGVFSPYSGNSQHILTPQSSNAQQINQQYKQNGFITNAYETIKLNDDNRPQDNNYGASNDGFGNKPKNNSKKGAFSWTSPEGQMYEVSYVADALSSRPQGNFIGSPQQIPQVKPPQHDTLNSFGNTNIFEQTPTFTIGSTPSPYNVLKAQNYNTNTHAPTISSYSAPSVLQPTSPPKKPYTRFPIF